MSDSSRWPNNGLQKKELRMKIESIVKRSVELEGSMSRGNAVYAACREVGVAESEIAGVASVVSAELTNSEMRFNSAAVKPSDRELLKLRANDKIEGDYVVLAFKKGRTVKMLISAWEKIVKSNHEPHAIAARQLLAESKI